MKSIPSFGLGKGKHLIIGLLLAGFGTAALADVNVTVEDAWVRASVPGSSCHWCLHASYCKRGLKTYGSEFASGRYRRNT